MQIAYMGRSGLEGARTHMDRHVLKRALEGLDFLVVQDIFMRETAELADVVLPAAVWVEREGSHTGVERRVEKINRIVDPPSKAKPDWWIITKLAHEMGPSREFGSAPQQERSSKRYVCTTGRGHHL